MQSMLDFLLVTANLCQGILAMGTVNAHRILNLEHATYRGDHCPVFALMKCDIPLYKVNVVPSSKTLTLLAT